MPALLLAALAVAPAPPAGDAVAAPAADAAKAGAAALSEGEKLSYALGVNVGRGLLRDGLDPDPALFLAGLRDALTGAPSRLTDGELAAALDAAAARVREAARGRRGDRRAAAERSAKFLSRFAGGENVNAAGDGILVRRPTTGSGAKPAATDRVRLHYAATVGGEAEPFFTTRGGDPAEAPVAALLPGLRVLLPTMPVGSRWEIALPADAAYGEAGGPGVPPAAALLLDVELLAVLPPAADPAPAEPAAP